MLLRATIVLLLALNLGVALWWALRPAPVPEAAPEQPPGVPRLQLLSEATPQARQTAATMAVATAGPEPEAPLSDAGEQAPPANAATDTVAAVQPSASTDPVPAAAERCLAFGPFDAAALAAARAQLQPQALRLRAREEVSAARGWRVQLPPLPDRDAAQAMAQKLRAAGFTDLFVIASGAEANAIALGRFSGEAGARRHADALRAAGFQAQAEPLGDASTRHWLDAAVAEGFDAAAARTAAGAARAETIDCANLR